MPKPAHSMEALARQAAERLARDRERGRQLALLPDEAGAGGARRVRGKGRALSQLRGWMLERGLKMPEDQLAELAGLAAEGDALDVAIARAERALAWAEDGGLGVKGSPRAPTTAVRLQTLMQTLALQQRALEALLPYVAPKVSPDVVLAPAAQVIPVPVPMAVPAQAADPAARARDVSPQARRIAPPPMPHQMQQNQSLTEAAADGSDVRTRTGEASG